jgi:hypothetical protein
MGIREKLFRKPPATPRSVRDWAALAEQRMREKMRSGVPSAGPEDLFLVLLHALSTYGDRRSKPDLGKMSGSSMDIHAHYSSDASLFELACYLYGRIDLWLFLNRPKLRDTLSCAFEKNLVALFSRTLAIDNVLELFYERGDMYAQIAREHKKAEEYLEECHFILCQLILCTKDGQLPQTFDHATFSLTLDALALHAVRLALLDWEEAMIPAIIESIEAYDALAGSDA